jgi:hypothetical protein
VLNETNEAIQLISTPRNASPSYSEFSFRAAGAASSKPDDNGYLKAKEGKVQTEMKILCIEKQMEHHQFVLSLQFFTDEEKNQSKEELKKLMVKLNDITDEP